MLIWCHLFSFLLMIFIYRNNFLFPNPLICVSHLAVFIAVKSVQYLYQPHLHESHQEVSPQNQRKHYPSHASNKRVNFNSHNEISGCAMIVCISSNFLVARWKRMRSGNMVTQHSWRISLRKGSFCWISFPSSAPTSVI